MYQYNPIGNGPESPTLSEHGKKTPQPLAPSAGQQQEGLTAEEASDSGDSLFVTQKPVPDAVRSRRRRHGKSSCLAYSRYLEESEAESSSSSSQEEPRTDKCSNRKKSCLPKYTFSYLAGNRPKDTALPAQKNRLFHTFAVAGFFKCLNEFSAKTSLPTVGIDGEDISPLSEEEVEKSHVHGFRVVDKRCFVTALKATSCQTWCNQRKQYENASCVGEKTLQEGQLKMQGKTPAEASMSMETRLSWHSKRSNNVVPSSNFQSETKEVDKLMPNTALKPTICLTLGAKEACRDNNSNTVVCEPLDVDGGWEVHNESQTRETVDTRGHQSLQHTTPSNNSNERICLGPRVKKTKGQTHASVEGQRQEESEGLLGFVTLEEETRRPQTTEEIVYNKRILLVEKTDMQERTSRKLSKRKEKKTKAASIVRKEYLESDVMITDSIISLEGGGKKKNNDADISHSEWPGTANGNFIGAEGVKIKHKKNRKDKRVITVDIHEESHSVARQLEGSGNESQNSSTFEKVEELSYSQRQKHTKKQQAYYSDAPQAAEVVDGHDSRMAATMKERIGKSHKQKRKRVWDEEEVSNALESNIPNSEGFAGDQSAKPVKNPKTKVHTSEDSVAQNNCSVKVQEKGRTTSSFLCVDAVEKDAQTTGEHISFRAEVQDTQSAEIITNLEHSDYLVKKRKRKLCCKDALHRGVERTKDSEGHASGGVTMESAAVLGPLQKKGKKHSCCMTVGTFDGVFKQASYSQSPEKQALKDKNSKTEMNPCADVPLQGELLTDSAHLVSRKKKEQTASPLTSKMAISAPEILSSDCVVRKKYRILKRKLYNPIENLFE